MMYYIIGLILFFGIHFIPSFPAVRESIIEKTGELKYKFIFGLFSFLGLFLVVYGLKVIPYIHVYTPPAWGRHATMLFMLPALYCFLSNSTFPFVPSSVRKLTAHPLNWGVLLWSTGHLLSNGDLAHVILFGSFGVFSLTSIYTGNLRGMEPKQTNHSIFSELIFALVVLAIYAGLMFNHQHFTGMPLF